MTLARQFAALSPWARWLIVFILIWVAVVFVFISKLNSPNTSDSDTSARRLNQAITYLEETKRKNAELREIIEEFFSDPNRVGDRKKPLIEELEQKFIGKSSRADLSGSANEEPNLEFERLRRRIHTNTKEWWNYMHTELVTLKKSVGFERPELVKSLDNFMDMAGEHKRSLLNDMNTARNIDGYESWRHQEARALSDLVQRRLTYLQNPSDCSKARKLVCRLNKGCGYGCQLHHVVYCFVMAYATERTLILKSKGWRYHKGGWEEVFKPISDTCEEADGASHGTWPGQSNTQILTVPIIDSLNPRPPYLPLAIPADLAPRLTRLHGDPIVWWIGQFLKYLLRPQASTQAMLDESIEKLGFKKPIVGVHVRRTDKVGTEAAFHGIEEYMAAVEDYYKQLEMVEKIDKRRIFLASDDPKVIDEARHKYPDYEIIGDADIARMAAVSTRYTDSSLNGIILDIHLLSLSDHLVCTFSSQVCRVAYEIMQTMYPDASDRFKSLDDIYYYGGQNAHNRQAVIAHKPRNHNEIHMKVGDLVGVAGNHWNGYSKGKIIRTNQEGLFPSFKVNDKVEIADFPTYSHVK